MVIKARPDTTTTGDHCGGCNAAAGTPHGVGCDRPLCAACGDARWMCRCPRTAAEAGRARLADSGDGNADDGQRKAADALR